MSKVYRDSPIRNAKHFNFDIYANSLSTIILNKENKTPFTIAINGKWGSGKTTLMRTLKSKLDSSIPNLQRRKVKTVWFDAWKYSECDSMLAALVSEILQEMGRKGFLDNLKSKILVGSEKVDLLKQMSDLAKILTLGNGPEFEKWITKTEYQNKLSFYDIFQNYMKTILQTFVLEKANGEYKDNEGVLVVFIDDLDRCSPKNIAGVLESINLFLDMEGCFFIIGTDISMIAKAIDAQYNTIEDFSGVEYIKKMIQLNFDLPLLKEEDIKEFMKHELQIDSELEQYFDIIVKGLRANQREIIRFLNSLNLMRILGESLEGETGYKEELLIKWNVLNFSSPAFVDEVKRKPDILFEIQSLSRLENEERTEYVKSLEGKELRERYYDYCENSQIIHVLSNGKEQFDLNNISTYLFLSSIVPKEFTLELSSPMTEIKPQANLQRADMENTNLIEVDLREANLREANLKGANLREADLWKANLKRANLQRANLMGANLSEAVLSEANLMGASLKETNLRRADLTGANLVEANLTGAYVEMANLMGANLENGILMGSNLMDSNLKEANLNKANLVGTNLVGTNLLKAELTDALLMNADLVDANLAGTNLKGANLMGTGMEESKLLGTNLEGANLRNISLSMAKLKNVKMKDAKLAGASFRGAELDNRTLKTILMSSDWESAFFDEDDRKKLEEMSEK